MKSLPTPIASSEIKRSDIPQKFRNWSELIEFAATFDFRKEGMKTTGVDSLTAESTICEMRSALFIEYRRYNHFGNNPTDEVFQACIQVVERIRNEI
jgi:hypothetical protein